MDEAGRIEKLMQKKIPCIFGEVLFDHFPDGHKVLGGAPFNVAWHLQAFGQAPFFISRVGNDPEGISIRKAMLNWGMDTLGLQTDSVHETGRVSIQFHHGEPEYDIVSPSAFDVIEETGPVSVDCDLLYHGSLALRGEVSRLSLEKLLETRLADIFLDVNLRDPWWNKADVLGWIKRAAWVKLNSDEFENLYPSALAGIDRLSAFLHEYQLQGVILTHGKAGAQLLNAKQEHFSIRPKNDSNVVDTVGAGDAFTSIIIMGLLNSWPQDVVLERAQQFASAIVGQRGATVDEPGFYYDFMDQWGLG
jgi:fructokinase